MFKKMLKGVKAVYDYFFKEEETRGNKTTVHNYSNVVQFAPRVAPAPVEAVRVRPVVRVSPAPAVAPAPVRDLRQEYKEWSQNMREYDKLRQRIAQ